ncbi:MULTISPECIES: aspartyl/asparaginyl beta-hydroxylase domain-containing protein [Streptomyces]|uniref:Aspartyl/asparaginyl beta-hydroxylase domain-containing protein n=1 Tax=Streptomyces fungicidicus TaxID=68203 RepID=A0ACC7XXE9_9ACTN|nr:MULTISPECIES: aspartyl/asparaginyl beta-hydroxylase domain-containing protein [Streptomyces]MBF4136269.1 aspartyl/asparaginyl beta-hydroxylase domain-containing protein [Streptomyces albidoflavus]NUV74367.1 aspartyl/asparaginyl beta-hydroxylase domain-containing protein [Streptomyces fungicidicus]PAX85857.1 aspartyl beta-hydroxylase [Streptomyces albidoflavus]PAX86521.1 aspartyl beta-hydroxylase [Streptomyces albidoflavus]PBO16274.1 aspartyl beta-hydroxylase [Streptomyces albidoflavus]
MKGSPSVNQPRIRAVTNWIFLRAAGPDRPRVILPEKVFPAARELEERFPALRAEIDALLEKRTIPAYGAFDPVRAAQVSEEWKLYYAYMYGQSNELARDEVPTLLAFAQSRPEVVNAFVSILDPGVELPPHKDPYAGVLRYHLGVRVPRVNPPHIRLDQDRHTWKEGEGRVLDVSVEHEVVNTSEEPRVVVIIDFRRPMGFFASALNRYMLRLKRKWAPQFVEASRYDVMHAA